jgi:putative NADPH-quinone reductase
MKKLIVIANPVLDSFSFKILNQLEKVLTSLDQEYEILDLYRCKPQQEFYTHQEDDSIKYFQSKISEANNLIFVHPLYWCSVPAILKNFLDQNFREGFAYKYGKEEKYIPLLKEKSMIIIITSNESTEGYKEVGNPYKIFWDEFSFGTGIKLEKLIHIGNMRGNSEERDDILKDLGEELKTLFDGENIG